MGVPEDQRAPLHRRLQPGDQVVAARGHWLPHPGDASRREPLREIVGDPALEIVGSRDISAHGVDTWPANEGGQQRNVVGA